MADLTGANSLWPNQIMTPIAILSLSQPHAAIASAAMSTPGPMEVLAQVSGYLFAVLAVILIIAAIETASRR